MAVFSDEDIQTLLTHPSVLSAKDDVSFRVPLSNTARTSLETRFGIAVPEMIPMRWMKGDTLPHIDRGPSDFKHTHLVYLTDSPGKLLIGGEEHPIRKNTGFVFDEGVSHQTVETGDVRRLMVGPFNELGEAVGGVLLPLPPTAPGKVPGSVSLTLETPGAYVLSLIHI